MIHRLNDIKLIVIDIDGTLVDKSGQVGDKTLYLSRELRKHDINCTLSSARSFYYSKHIADLMEVDTPIITLDGALIEDRKGEIIYKGAIKDSVIKKAIRLAEQNYGKITMCNEEHLYITPKNSVIKEYTRLNAPIKEVSSFEGLKNILEILIYCEDKGSLKVIREYFKFPHTMGVYYNVTKSPSNEYYLLTIKKNGSDKLNSVKRLVKHLNLKRRNIAVIGDWHNDMPLFNYGAYNFAVQNAIPELKRKADYITNSTNDEDAVSEVLELVLNYKTGAIKDLPPVKTNANRFYGQ
ncbi:MAG: HAD family hydrolase [Ignavibacteria bacterium]|jgi:Cof subfamily protein (haloacid dehalogenase superfamily)